MTTTREGALQLSPAPVVVVEETDRADSVANQLLNEIASLEQEVQSSNKLARKIEDRSWWDSIWSSTSKDLTYISKTQNTINNKMINLIQRTIKLSMLSHAGLIRLMHDLQEGTKNGFLDANGRIKRLAHEGTKLAEMAVVQLSSLIDASNSTREKNEQNSNAIRQQNIKLDGKTIIDSHQSRILALLAKQVREKGDLDARQQASIDEQGLEIDRLMVQMALLNERLGNFDTTQQQYQDGIEIELLRTTKRMRRWQWSTLSLSVIQIVWLVILTLK